jgi:cysteine desulfurase
MNIDLLSISGHKIYAPKGIGALYVRRKPRVRIVPQISGGGQEKGLRSGTLAPHLCVGLGEASRVAMQEMDTDKKHVSNLRDRLLNGLQSRFQNLSINGDELNRYAGCINFTIEGVSGANLIDSISSIAVSAGQACTSEEESTSYVL